MAIGTPTSLGSTQQDAAEPYTFNTTGTAPSDSKIIVFAAGGKNGTGATTITISGGGLTWTTDGTAQGDAFSINWVTAVCSANASAGLASGTTLTVTYSSANMFGIAAAVVYVTGLETTSFVDVTDGQFESVSDNSWDTTATSTTVADTLVIGGNLCDGNLTTTATGGASLLFDVQQVTNAWRMAVEYKILSSAASTSLTGTLSGSSAAKSSVFVAYKAAASTPITTSNPFSSIPLVRGPQ